MNDRCTLESELKNLKLTKRSFLLEGKDTNTVDVQIKLLQSKLKDTVYSMEEKNS